MRRVVLDTSVVVASFRSPSGASRRVVELVAHRVLVPVATIALFLEYEEVLKRPEQRAVSGLSLKQVDVALAGLASLLEPVEVHFRWRPQLADSGDEMVLDAAVNGRADALMTHNAADFTAACARFGVPVMSPGRLVERMRG